MNTNYRPRIVDAELINRLQSIGAIVIEGAKWCGKSTTAEHHSKSCIYLDNPTNKERYRFFAEQSPELILDGETPRLIDEWQLAPTLWDSIRYTIDHRQGMGQFILTGSAKPADRSRITHSGTGRFAWLKMRPMSLYESGDSTGAVSLKELFENPQIKVAAINNTDIQRIAYLVCRGGWPAAINLPEGVSINPAYDYYSAVVNVDIQQVDGINRSAERAKRLMRSYARFQGTQTPIRQITNDINGNDSNSIDDQTVRSYLDALRSMFVIEDMPAWNPNLKSKTAIRTTDTRYFVDPSIAAAALGVGIGDLLNDLKTFGFLFETLCVRDLRVYAQAIRGEVYHYRDKNGLECDAVIHLPNGNYGLVEIKLGGDSAIESGASTLKTLANKIDTSTTCQASFLMVITGVGSYAYQRKDGVFVVPITCLKD
jgi:predicted AAA+ superfamily ATPase